MSLQRRAAIRKQMFRVAARNVCANANFPPEVIVALAENFCDARGLQKTAFVGLTRKLGQIVDAFKKAPALWESFKKTVGINSLADVPSAIKRLADAAKKALSSAIHKMFDSWPLKLYTLDKGKLFSFNDLISKILDKAPGLKRAVESVAKKAADFGELLRQQAPRIMGVAMLGIYVWVWLNVTEFEWDLKSLTDAVAGRMTFPDFLASLPGSGFGLLLNSFGFGTFTLLPYTIAARFLYLLAHRYIGWDGHGFVIHWDALEDDFGVREGMVPALGTL